MNADVSPATGSDAPAAAQHLFHTIGAIKALVLRQRPSSFFSPDDGDGRLFCTGRRLPTLRIW
jgi:hypothetical protein